MRDFLIVLRSLFINITIGCYMGSKKTMGDGRYYNDMDDKNFKNIESAIDFFKINDYDIGKVCVEFFVEGITKPE